MPRLKKTLEYRRARFLEDGQNLEVSVRQAWRQFPNQSDRAITYRDGRSTTGLRSHDYGNSGIAVHCGRYMDGQGVGTIQTRPAPAVDVNEQPPNPGENYLNSDMMALIKDNHVICMNCGKNAGSLRIYLQNLFKTAGFADAASQFELVRVGSPDTIALIQNSGVKKIDLKAAISEAAGNDLLEVPDASAWDVIQSSFSRIISSIADRDQDLEGLRSAEKGDMTISINVPNGDLDLAKGGLDNLSEDIVEDEESDNYVIHIRGGGTIKPDEVSVQKQVQLNSAANSVSVLQAWGEMVAYIEELQENGQLGV